MFRKHQIITMSSSNDSDTAHLSSRVRFGGTDCTGRKYDPKCTHCRYSALCCSFIQVYAVELGCDWVYPKPVKPNASVSKSTLYCHSETANGRLDIKKGDTLFEPSARCTLNNWLMYFSFGDQMVRAEVSNKTAFIVVSLSKGSPVFLR